MKHICLFLIAILCLSTIIPLTDKASSKSDIWIVVERGPTWNMYQRQIDSLAWLQTYSDLINYKDEQGNYKEIKITDLKTSLDGSYNLASTPYRFKLDQTKRYMTIYPDRNNPMRYVKMYMPPQFIMNNKPFWENKPSLSNAAGTISWISTNFNIQIRLDNSKIYFEYTLKNTLAFVTNFNMTVIPYGMSFEDIGFINILHDATGVIRPLNVIYDKKTYDMRISFDVSGLTYPIVVDPSLSFYSGEQDCYIGGRGTNYNTIWTASSGSLGNTTTMYFGQYKSGLTYYIYRDYFFFNISSISSDFNIVAATINFYVIMISKAGTVNVVVQNGQPVHPQNPPVAGDYDKSFYSGDGGILAYGGVTINSYNALPLNTTGLSWLNRTAMTKLCIRSSTDISGTAPAGDQRILFYAANQAGTSYDPYISVYFYIETSVDSLPSTVIMSPYDVNVTGSCDLDNVSLLYRYKDLSGSYNWSIGFSGGVCDDAVIQEDIISDTFYQTFMFNRSCYFGNLSMWMKKDGGDAYYYVSFYECNDTGYPNLSLYLGNSGVSVLADMKTTYGWVSVHAVTNIFFKNDTLYAFQVVAVPELSQLVYIGYNVSDVPDYEYGKRFTASNTVPPVWSVYEKQDFLFNMSYSWLLWNDTAMNPDVVCPWSFPFNFSDGYGTYEFYSLGTYSGGLENYSFANDTWTKYINAGFLLWLFINDTYYLILSLGCVFLFSVCFFILFIRRKKMGRKT